MAGEIKSLKNDIEGLDKSVADVTSQRKSGNEAIFDLVSSNTQAKKLIEFAINRLQKFYNPKLHIPAKSALEQISSSDTSASAPAAPPPSVGAYREREEFVGVISMMNLFIKDPD